MTGGFVGRLRSTCAPCKMSSSGYLPPLKVTGLKEAPSSMEPVARRIRRWAYDVDKLQMTRKVPEQQCPSLGCERRDKESSHESRSKSLPTLPTLRPMQTRTSPDICKQRSLPPLRPIQVAPGSRETLSPRSLLRPSSGCSLPASNSAPPTARRLDSSVGKLRLSENPQLGALTVLPKPRRSLSSSSLTCDFTTDCGTMVERGVSSPRVASNPSMRRRRLEPLGASAAKLSLLASALAAESCPAQSADRVRMVDSMTVVPEEVFMAMMRLGKEARRRGQHVHACGPLLQSTPRLMLPGHLPLDGVDA